MKKITAKDFVIGALLVTNLTTAGVVVFSKLNARTKRSAVKIVQPARIPIQKETDKIEEFGIVEQPQTQNPDTQGDQTQSLMDKIDEQTLILADQSARLRLMADRINLLGDANAKTDTRRREEAAAKMLAFDMYGRFLNVYALEHGFSNEEHNRELEVDKFVMATKYSIEEEAHRLINSGWNPYRLTSNKGTTGKSYFDIGISYENTPLRERTMLYLFSSPDRFKTNTDSVIGMYRDVFLEKIPSHLRMGEAGLTVDFEAEK